MTRSLTMPLAVALATVAAIPLATRAAVILPVEGSTLQRTHVEVRWAPVDSVSDYQLQVVIDDGSASPFEGGATVVDLNAGGTTPGAIITSGLEFDAPYAWRVRGLDPSPRPWGPTHRFSIAPLPPGVPPVTISASGGAVESGVTMFNLFTSLSGTTGLALAVDLDGEPVWFHTHTAPIVDLRLAPNGRVQYTVDGRGFEATLDGQITWSSPDDPHLFVHHEMFPMPGGNLLALLHDPFEVEVDGETQTWIGDRIVEFDRRTKEVVWEWSTNDHYSTLDFDPTMMMTPQSDGSYDWTHSNAVIYNEADNSVYISVRHLSRVTRIDYDTREIVYNMGFAMPSGDDDFGDNLFSFQHAVQMLPSGNMMLYDNGNRRDHMDHDASTGVTKAIELAFTEGAGGVPVDASIEWEYTASQFTPFIGDADRLPGGNTLVTVGAAAEIVEVAPDGEEVWTLGLIDLGGYLIYRSERVPSLVIPAACDCSGDLDCSQFVDMTDLFEVLDAWGGCPDAADCPGDVDGDGQVTMLDLLEVLSGWGPCP